MRNLLRTLYGRLPLSRGVVAWLLGTGVALLAAATLYGLMLLYVTAPQVLGALVALGFVAFVGFMLGVLIEDHLPRKS